MKKIIILTLPLFFLMPIFLSAEADNENIKLIPSNVDLDYENGLLDQPELIQTNTIEDNLQDNDLGTAVRAPSSVRSHGEVIFKDPMYISYLFLYANHISNSGYRFYFNNGSYVTLGNLESEGNRIYKVDLDNVISIEFETTGSARYFRIYEIDFFGRISDLEKPEDVKNINVEEKHDRVNLSWELPKIGTYDHVNIYRKDLGKNEQKTDFFNLLKPMTVQASDEGFNPLFETNGTYFNDLSVDENSSYEYKLETELQGLTSDGVIVQAQTGISPAPPIEGGGGEQQDNGDYLVTWLNPREGQIRIFVDGQEYTVAEAEAGQYLIPGADMKYNALGEPLVSWQSIAPNGQEGTIQAPEGLENPVKVKDVLKEGVNLVYLVSSFLLLGLAFIFAPKVIKLIRQAFNNKKEQGNGRGKTRQPRKERESRVST